MTRVLFSSQTAEEWEHASALAVVPLKADRMRSGFLGTLARDELTPDVSVVQTAARSHELTRSRALADSSADSGLLLELSVRGGNHVEQSGRRVTISAGSAVFYDTRIPYRLSFPGDNSALLIQVPRSRIPVSERSMRKALAVGVAASSPSHRLLREYLRIIRPILPDGPAELMELSARTIADLVGALAREIIGDDQTDGPEALVVKMMASARQRLDDPRLGPAMLAALHGVSLRTVHSGFARVGLSPAAWIRRERLRRAEVLVRAGRAHIDDIAFACGFQERSTFVRAFIREYGVAPGVFRTGARIGGETSAPPRAPQG